MVNSVFLTHFGHVACVTILKLFASLFKQVGLVYLCHFTTAKCQICQTEYMFLTHGGDGFSLQLHTVGAPIFYALVFP
jgi:hypothetical protein